MLYFTENNVINQTLAPYSECSKRARRELQKMWGVFYADAQSVLELRALWPKGVPGGNFPLVRHYGPDQYPSLDSRKAAFEEDALSLNTKGYNIYTLLNPLKRVLPDKNGAKNLDIQRRCLLLVDIDRTGETSEPATDTEVAAAKLLAIQIRDFMRDHHWPEPIAVMSGNGYHLYFALGDIDNDDGTSNLIKSVLAVLASKFNNSNVSVDTCVHNASRITKVPGTVMRKGIESEARPYRMAEVCHDL